MTKRIRTLLVANRGEIACRIARCCRSLGIRTVAVYSEPDRDLPHVRAADLAVCIGPARAESSYLDAAAIIDAARRTAADAVHPGYGFLAENADFAQSVGDAGLVWVGPPPEAIRRMGDKAAARRLAAAEGVPCVPGTDEAGDDPALTAAAEKVGYPLLVKAVAGGGGRGMRRVDGAAELAEALEAARREAGAAFGDDRLLLERLIERPRHVEVQLVVDAHGQGIHLFERECSIQRRHQKIVEEAPSPAVDEALRQQITAAALQIARRVGYLGAGTVEFLVAEGAFFFLEMNTRLQVEHPVTEAVTGLDLVALQLAIAEGAPLPLTQQQVGCTGHAIEARIYAEDPLRDYLPQTGELVRFEFPVQQGVRVDAGYQRGNRVEAHYDPLLAKVIAHGADREQARRRLAHALHAAWIPGVATNLPLLRQLVEHPAFAAAALDTGFLQRHGLPSAPPLNLERGALVATAHGWAARRQRAPQGEAAVPGWRLEGPARGSDRWRSQASEVEVGWRVDGDRLALEIAGEAGSVAHRGRLLGLEGDELTLELDGLQRRYRVARSRGAGPAEDGDVVYVHLGEGEAVVALLPRFPSPLVVAEKGSCLAPTPGAVAALHVELGQQVEAGQVLVTLEAMKMEHPVRAPSAGVVAEVAVQTGQQVDQGALLVRLQR